MPRRRRSRYVVALLVAAVLVNLPLVHGAWTSNRIDRDGEDVTATVVDHRTSDSWFVLTFLLPQEIDPDQTEWTAEVDEATYDTAVAEGTVEVRVLPDDPAQHEVAGEVGNGVLVIITLVADLLLLAMALLAWWARRREQPPLRAIAVEDVRRGQPGGGLTQISPETYLVSGEVSGVAQDRVVLDLGERTIEVLLDGHLNPVGYQQPAQVHARLL